MTLDGSASSDPDGTIVRYEWDLDGNGSFESDGGAQPDDVADLRHRGHPSTSQLRVTDNGGKTATATVPVTVNSGGVSHYGDAVLDTPGPHPLLAHGRAERPDARRQRRAPARHGHRQRRLRRARRPSVRSRHARRTSTASRLREAPREPRRHAHDHVEFWLKWDAPSGTTASRWSSRPTTTAPTGGFLVDPNAPQFGGTFARRHRPRDVPQHVLLRPADAPACSTTTRSCSTRPRRPQRRSRRTSTARPVSLQEARQRHRRRPVRQRARCTSCRAPARACSARAISTRSRSTTARSARRRSTSTSSSWPNRRPVARFTATPNPVATGQTVTFNGSTSSDPDGSITKYEWDLDGNGTYETNTGSTPTATRAYATEGTDRCGLRVTDNLFGTDTETKTLEVGNKAPVASYTITPNPAIAGRRRRSSTPAGRAISTAPSRKYEWDLDGNGTYETDTRPSPTASQTYAASGTVDTRLRLTDNQGATGTATLPVTINAGGVSQLRRRRARHSRPRQLLAHGRGERADVRRQQGHQPRDRGRRRASACPGRHAATRITRRASTASTTSPRRTSTSPAPRS